MTYAQNDKAGAQADAKRIFFEAVRLHKAGSLEAAYAGYRKAVEINPDFPEALSNLGLMLVDMGQFEAAVECCQRSLYFKPASMDTLVTLCRALTRLGRIDVIEHYCRTAHQHFPFAFEPLLEMGRLYWATGKLDKSIVCLKKAASLKPDLADIHAALGFVQRLRGLLPEAAASCRRAIALDPNHADAHGNLAIALLAMGCLPEGWREYEWRWKTPGLAHTGRGFHRPQWRGEQAIGKTLLIHSEQGFGDTIQFCRYASLAAEKGLAVILEVEAPLKNLMQSLAGVDRVIERGAVLPRFDLHCPMMSLPLAFATDLANIPSRMPYLAADSDRVLAWQSRLAGAAGTTGVKVAFAWAGGKKLEADERRSIPLERLRPIIRVPGIIPFSLQKDLPVKPEGLHDFMDDVKDFSDTAALIANLDLVISVDTSVAHLAAAMGKPCWLLNRFDSCWRWLTDRRDSPWYPSLTLYNQPSAGDWDAVIGQVARDLSEMSKPLSTP